jgi:hypothetical protein
VPDEYEHSSSNNRDSSDELQKQNVDFLENNYNNFGQISVVYGNHLAK